MLVLAGIAGLAPAAQPAMAEAVVVSGTSDGYDNSVYYLGNDDTGTDSNNTLTINSGTFVGAAGGSSVSTFSEGMDDSSENTDTAAVSGNSLIINDPSDTYQERDWAAGGVAINKDVTGNTVTVNYSTTATEDHIYNNIDDDIIGGSTITGSASDNKTYINGVKYNEDNSFWASPYYVYGGYSYIGPVSGNEVHLNGGFINNNVAAGAQGNADGSTTTDVMDTYLSDYAESLSFTKTGDVTDNKIYVDGAYVVGTVYGGYMYVPASSDGAIVQPGSITGNTVDVSNSANIYSVYGGYGYYTNAGNSPISMTDNTVTIKDSIVGDGHVAGGYAETDDYTGQAVVSGNKVTLTNATVNPSTPWNNRSIEIYGGSMTSDACTGSTVDDNEVTVSDSTIGTTQAYTITVAGGYGEYDTVSNNTLTVSGSTFQLSDLNQYQWIILAGGEKDYVAEESDTEGNVVNNTATLTDNTIVLNTGHPVMITGGLNGYRSNREYNVYWFGAQDSIGNTLNMSGNIIGAAAASATENENYIAGGVAVGRDWNEGTVGNTFVYTYYPANATSNTANITSGTVGVNALDVNYIAGGMVLTDGNAQSNTLNISGGTIGAVSGNTNYVNGGYTALGDATGNTLNISGGTIGTASGSNSYIAGGYTASGTASGNTVNISGGTFGEAASASDTETSEETGTAAEDDATDITTLSNYIAGGYSADGEASDNTVNLTGTALETTFSLYGGLGQTSTGNTLNVYTKGNSVGNLGYFQNINFYIPAGTESGDTMLTVTGTADVSGAAIKAGIQDESLLNTPKTITLIYDANGITTSDKTTYGALSDSDTANGTIKVVDAAFLTANATIGKTDDNTIAITLPAKPSDVITPDNNNGSNSNNSSSNSSSGNSEEVIDLSKITLSKDTKLFAETREASLDIVKGGANLLTGAASSAAASAWKEDGKTGAAFVPYAAIGGNSLRHDTGSYVDSHGLAANVGFVRKIDRDGATDTIMPFIEYGRGTYDSHLDDGARDDGNNHYTGAGILVRRDFLNGLYYEGSARAGYMKGDFHGLIEGYMVRYDSGTPYLAMYAGLGKVYTRGSSSYDVYGKFFWTHLGSDSAIIRSSLGNAKYDFGSANSYVTRIGLRWTKDYSDLSSLYAGIGWDYEFDSETRANYETWQTPRPSEQGSSGFLELGWKSKVTDQHPWGFDIRATGWAGKQRGITYYVGAGHKF